MPDLYCPTDLAQPKESPLPTLSLSNLYNPYQLAQFTNVVDFATGAVFREYVTKAGWTVADLRDPSKKEFMNTVAKAFINNMLADFEEKEGTWKDISPAAYQNLKSLHDHFDLFAREYSVYNNLYHVKDFDNVEEDEEFATPLEATEEQPEAQAKEFDRTGNEQSQLELAGADTKVLFRLLPMSEPYLDKATNTYKSQLLLDRDGLPRPAEFIPTWNLLLEQTNGIKDEAAFIQALKSDKTLRIVPEVGFLNDILKLDKEDKTTSEVKQFVSFYQRFSKPKVAIKTQFQGKDGNVTLADEIRGNTLKIESRFIANFTEGNIPEAYKKYVHRAQSGTLYLQKLSDDFFPPIPETHEDRIQFLAFLGVQFSGVDMLEDHEREEFYNLVATTAPRLYASLKGRLEEGKMVRDPLKDLKSRYGQSLSESASLKSLVAFESRYSRIAPTHSSRTVTGEKQNLIQQDSALSLASHYLNTAPTLEVLLTTPPFRSAQYNTQFKNSYVINFLFDQNGNRRVDNGQPRTLNLELLGGNKKQAPNGKITAELESKLSPKNKLIQDYSNFLLFGKTDIMRTETSNSFFMLGLYKEGKSQNYIDPKGFSTSFFESTAFTNQILNYLNGEIRRINSYEEKKRQNPSLDKSYGEFAIFSEVQENNPELAAQLVKAGTLTTDSALWQQFKEAYGNVLNQELEAFKAGLNQKGITEEQLLSKSLKDLGQTTDALHRAFIAGTLVQNIEFATLYLGDSISFKDLHKRLKGLSSTGNISADLPMLQKYFQSTPEQQYRANYSLGGALGTTFRDNTGNFKSQTLKEYGVKPTYGYLSEDLIPQMQQSLTLRDGHPGKYTEEYLKKLLKDREDPTNFKPADGQGYMNLDYHRELAFRFGFHTSEMEAAYKYEGLVMRKAILNQTLSTEQERELQQLEATITANPDKYALPVLKLTYWGGIENTTVDQKAYDKFSTAPILPSLAKNHPALKELMLDMVKGQYGYVKYKSGTKMFSTTPVESLKGATADLLTTQLLKEQIKTNPEQKTQTSIPTQLLKLIFSNLFSEGKGKTEKAQQLYEEYLSILKDIQGHQRATLLDDLGITREGSSVSVDLTTLKEKLIDQAKKQQYNSNILTALHQLGTVSPEASGFQAEINNLLSGIIDKTLRRFKFTGGDFVLVSNAHLSPLPWYQFSQEGTKAPGCRIALTKEFSKLLNRTHPDGNRIGTRDRLNKLLENDAWVAQHEKELTVVLDRVPTQGMNSMDYAVVREFLSPTHGNAIILPDEIVTKSGTDFDYDKEKVLSPALTQNGHYIEPVKNLDEQITALKENRKGLLTEYYKSKNPSKTIQQIREYVQQVTLSLRKGDFASLKPSAQEEVKDIHETFTQITNLEVAKDYLQEQLDRTDKYANEEEDYNLSDTILSANQEAATQKEMEELRDNINQLTATYYGQLKQFESKEAFTAINEGYQFKEKLRALAQMQDAVLPSHGNRIIQTYKNTLALPESFADLIAPNTTLNIKDLAEKTAEETNRSLTLPSKGRTLYYSENLKVFHNFFSNKNMLAPFAKDNTYQQLLTYLGVNMNQAYNGYNSATGTYTIPEKLTPLLLTPEEESKLYQDGKILTSLRDDIDGYAKQLWNSESINATVDSAKDPFFAFLRILPQNVGIVNLLKNQGLPLQRIIDFVNHPTLQYYFTLRQNGMDRRTAIEKMAEDRLTLGTKRMEEKAPIKRTLLPNEEIVLGSLRQDGKNSYMTVARKETPNANDLLRLFKQIEWDGQTTSREYAYINKWINQEPITPERLHYLALPENDRQSVKKDPSRKGENLALYSDEIRLVAHFFNLEKANFAFRDYQRYFDFDTNKLGTIIAANAKQNLEKKVRRTAMFSIQDLQEMSNHSILAAFINTNMVKSIYEKVFPILAEKETQETLTELYQAYDVPWNTARNDRDARNMPTIIYNDFLSSILFSFGEYNSKNLMEAGKPLLLRTGARATMVDKLIAFRKAPYYETVARDFPILDKFISNKLSIDNAYDRNNLDYDQVLENVQFLKSPSETLLEQENTIEQLRNLYYNYTYTQGTPAQNEKINSDIKTFLRNLFITGMLQSGFSKSYMSYQEYIPFEFKQDVYKDAIAKFQQLSPGLKGNYLDGFTEQFKNNNPRYFPTFKEGSQTVTNANNYSDRFKPYFINPTVKESQDLKPADSLTPIEQNFRDGEGGRTMQPKFKGKSTMDLILSGDRTRTTRANTDIQRMLRDYKLSDITQLTGRIIRMTDKQGRVAYTRITGIYPLTQAYQDQTWQKEGWTKDVTDKLVGKYPYAIEFELAQDKEAPKAATPEQEPTPAQPKPLSISEITRATKKESFNFTLKGEDKLQTKEGYRIQVKEYPDFKGYVYKEGNHWYVVETTLGYTISVTSDKIKDILPELQEIFNKAAKNEGNLQKLRSINLFTDEVPADLQLSNGQTITPCS